MDCYDRGGPRNQSSVRCLYSRSYAYIKTLDEGSMPLEYKLLDYKPEPWTNLKSALFLKYMAWDLAGGEEDFAHTECDVCFTKQQYDLLYPL